jgi:hypothetical protein
VRDELDGEGKGRNTIESDQQAAEQAIKGKVATITRKPFQGLKHPDLSQLRCVWVTSPLCHVCNAAFRH